MTNFREQDSSSDSEEEKKKIVFDPKKPTTAKVPIRGQVLCSHLCFVDKADFDNGSVQLEVRAPFRPSSLPLLSLSIFVVVGWL